MSAPEYTEGVCDDGAAILKDGVMITISEILEELNSVEVHVSQWNFDMATAPRGEELARVVKTSKGDRLVPHYEHVRIIAAGSKGTVTLSRWLPDEGRWEMFTKDTPPIAWMPWPTAPEVPS